MTLEGGKRRVVVDKMYLLGMGGEEHSRPLYEAIAKRCDHLVLARRLAEAPSYGNISPKAVPRVHEILGEYRLGDRTINKIVPVVPARSILPDEVRAVANAPKIHDDYVLEEAALHGAALIITQDSKLRARLSQSPACVRWLHERGIVLLSAEEYLASVDPAAGKSAGAAPSAPLTDQP